MSEVSAIIQRIDRELPDMARAVIRRHLDLSDLANQRFLEAPDDREQHQTEWHQWGIITHTRVFLRDLDTLVPDCLRRWGLWDEVDVRLSAGVDGVSRWQLLQISVLLHDIGKFAARRFGRHRFHFARHEEYSGAIIRDELALDRYGLTPSQIAYIARTAEDHFVLGLLRKRAREQGTYDQTFVQSDRFAELTRQIKRDHPGDYVEIGVLFLGDSLAKVNPRDGPERAVGQYELNVDVARRYLDLVLGDAA